MKKNLKQFKDNFEIAVILTFGGSLENWKINGILKRELKIYEELYNDFGVVTNIISFGEKEESFKKIYPFIRIKSNSYGLHPRLYNHLIPILFFKTFQKIKIIKTNQFYGTHIAKTISKIFNKPLIIRQGYNFLKHIENEHGQGSISYKKAQKYEKKFINCGDVNIFTSKFIASEYEKKYKVDPNKIKVIPNYVIKETWEPSYQIKKNNNTLIFFGRLVKQKNLFSLCNALKELKKKIIFIGNGYQKTALKDYLEKYKIEYEIKERLPQSKILYYLKQSDFFILPSLYEGNPKSLIEMMIYKIPTISSRVIGNNEIQSELDFCLTCDTSSRSIKKSIINFYKLSIPQKKMITKKAYEYAIRKYDVRVIAQKEYKIYQSVLE